MRDCFGLVRSSILQPDGNIQVCGTIYDDGDLHREMEQSGVYNVYKRPAIFENGSGKKALWPIQYDLEKLEEIRSDPTVGNFIFSCQYLLDPAPENESSYFQLGWFKRYDALPETLNYFVGIDFAISEEQSADYTSIVVVGLDYLHEIYVTHVRRGQWDSLGIIDNMIEVQSIYKPLVWVAEKGAIEKAIGPFLSLKMRQKGVYLNIEKRTPVKDKVSRARSIQGRAREGAIWLPKKGLNQPGWLNDFSFELSRFPKGRNDDQVDALAWIGIQLDSQFGPHADKPIIVKTAAETHIEQQVKGKATDYEAAARIAALTAWKDIETGLQRQRGTYSDVDGR